MNKLILATEQGIVTCEREGDDWIITTRGLTDQHVTSVIVHDSLILAGTKDGVHRSDDEGATWEEASHGLTARHVRWMAYHPNVSNLEFAGTEPANIFVSHDNGDTWQASPEVAHLREKFKWSLPYSPEAGCVRGFAIRGLRIYAAVEVGGVLVSNNNGETWQLAEGSDGKPDLEGPPEPFVYPDVHSLEVHPSSADLVYAPTGGGFYRSNDGGKTWKLHYDCYCRAVWVDRNDPEHLILGPADNVDANGRIEASHDGGKTWSLASNGLKVPWRHSMVERFFQAEDELFAVLSNGQLFSTALPALEWKRVLPNITGVTAITTLV